MVLRAAACILAALAIFGAPPPAAKAEVVSKMVVKRHPVSGTDARSLVKGMFHRPLRAGHGPALATLQSSVSMDYDIATPRGKRGCRINRLDFDVKFVMTLPRATQRHRLSPATARLWQRFVDDARRHEDQHRSIILGCFKRIERRGLALRPSASCNAVGDGLMEIIKSELARCETKHEALDSRDAKAIPNEPLFREARLTPKELQAYASLASRRLHYGSRRALMLRRSGGWND